MMKKSKFCLLILLAISLTGCFSNQQLKKSTQLVGDWTLKGGVCIPGVTKHKPKLIINADMKVSGFTGCNQFKGRLIAADGSFTLPTVTRRICLPELVTQEENMLNVLRSATSIEVINNTLVIDSGNKFLVFEKTNAS
ncbi:heat-inducible protein [Photobacterium malacitanum]|uniref:Heat-inducible protein n=1 Tax=Photobacterium malacitanum TaxID=2204294 RepID=A0A1Y6MG31_9GAMM|nr:META domain-containing protein [Photobacterium malacitanum]SMY35545.1 heat-inducible protein [Photobacterium malacitanum]